MASSTLSPIQHRSFWQRHRVLLLTVTPVVLFLVSLCLGRYMVSPGSTFAILLSQVLPIEPFWSSIEESVILQVRLPRLLLSMIVGAGLAVAGVSFQGLFRNPLVSPDILGVSAGAGFGACLGILISYNSLVIQGLALAFGIIAVLLSYAVGRLKKSNSLLMLVLAGVITGALFTALIGLTKYIADPEDQLPTIVYWLMGSMAGASYKDLLWGAPPILIGMGLLVLLRWRINVLSLGEEEALSLGINTQRTRWLVISAATLVTASSVALCGMVGWIGLVIPHIGRMLVGPNHGALLPACVSIGAFSLLFIDNLARFATPAEIPLSILTAIIGAPFFAFLLQKTGGRWA